MKRKILFRGKRLDNGEWACGSLVSFENGEKAILPSASKVFKQRGTTTICCNECYGVDPATVGQYTGLTDKNSVKIFEGDIVKLNSALYFVDWISHVGMFALRYVGNWESVTDFSIIGPERCVVCGNVHDNPDGFDPERSLHRKPDDV